MPAIWDKGGWTLFLGGLFIAAWSAYAFETAVCYMSEFKNPGRDMPRAIICSGVFCIFAYILVPFVFQGVLGTKYMLDPASTQAPASARPWPSMVGRRVLTKFLVVCCSSP